VNLTQSEAAAILAIPEALARLTKLVQRSLNLQRRRSRTYLTPKDVARELRYKDASSVWAMPEVMAERRYPTGTSTPRWTREGLARAVANMPREPKVRGRKAMRNAA